MFNDLKSGLSKSQHVHQNSYPLTERGEEKKSLLSFTIAKLHVLFTFSILSPDEPIGTNDVDDDDQEITTRGDNDGSPAVDANLEPASSSPPPPNIVEKRSDNAQERKNFRQGRTSSRRRNIEISRGFNIEYVLFPSLWWMYLCVSLSLTRSQKPQLCVILDSFGKKLDGLNCKRFDVL